MNTHRLTRVITIAWLAAGLASPALASSHLVEAVVEKVKVPEQPEGDTNPRRDGRRLEVRIVFTEYLSSAHYATPADTRTFTGIEAWDNSAAFVLDGTPINAQAGRQVLREGASAYITNNRSAPKLRALSLVTPPTMGTLAAQDGQALVLRRLITNKFASAGIVFADQAVSLDADARILLDGKPSDAATAITEDRLIRVFEPQALMLSAFTEEAMMLSDTLKQQNLQGVLQASEDGAPLFKPVLKFENDPEAFPLGGSGLLLDLQFHFHPKAATPHIQQTTGYISRVKRRKIGRLVARSKASGIVDGTITAIDDATVSVKLTHNDDELKVVLADVSKFFLDGRPQDGTAAFAVGMPITIYQKRPQTVDVWSGSPWPDLTASDQEQVLFDVDGNRKIIQEGSKPSRLMQTKKK